MQPHLIENLRQSLRELKLEQHEERFLPHARLAFDLVVGDESEGEVGESRWGGAPDVPADFSWPHFGKFPLAFLTQINLADLIPDPENPFPASGLLQFFADFESDGYLVVLHSPDVQLQVATVPEGANDYLGDLTPHRLTLEPRADLPQWATEDYVEITDGLSDEEQDAYGQLSQSDSYAATPERQALAGQLLGHVAGIGYDPREGAFEHYEVESGQSFEHDNPAHKEGARRWQNLLRFDSALDLVIGDAGYFNFLIHEDDLKRLNFSRIHTILESS